MGDTATSSSPDNPLRDSTHPVTVFFTLFFKVIAMLCYIFLNFFISNFVITFIIIILCLACDFWTIKNVSGRLLVGLRWWNKVHPDGTSEWVFESSATKKANKFDRLVFWGTLYITPVVWGILGLLFSGLDWLMVVFTAIGLSIANLIGYWKCLRSGGKNLKKFAAKQAAAVAIDNIV